LPMRPFYLTRLSSHTACKAGALDLMWSGPESEAQNL
jgi:hypothetical protein